MHRTIRAVFLVLLSLAACGSGAGTSARHGATSAPTLDELWAGKAHFQQVGTLDWTKQPGGDPTELAGWIATRGDAWYVFNRVTIPATAACPNGHWRTVVRRSTDQGRTWTAPTTAIEPGESTHGDHCAALDGSTIYDAPSATWHILAQCLDTNNAGGWQLCHYTRAGASPLGRFAADPQNPVVRSGSLWAELCAAGGVCTGGATHGEGTPDIVGKRDGRYVVTFHGYDTTDRNGLRGVATTPDFRSWRTTGPGLPGVPTLSARDCRAWFPDCVGFGEASALSTRGWTYLVTETMNKDLGCTPGQRWVFALLRTRRGVWPATGSGWRTLPGPPLLRTSWPDPATQCAVQYARLWTSGGATWLMYEDYDHGRNLFVRRLMKLVPGGGPRIVKTAG